MNFDYLKNNNFTANFVAKIGGEQFHLEPISILGNRFVEISPFPSEVVGSAKTIHFLVNEDSNFGSFAALKKLLSIPVGATAQSKQFANFVSDFSIKTIGRITETSELVVDLNIQIGNKILKIQGCANFEVINFFSGLNMFDSAQSILSPKQKLDNLKNMVMHQVTCTYSDLIIT